MARQCRTTITAWPALRVWRLGRSRTYGWYAIGGDHKYVLGGEIVGAVKLNYAQHGHVDSYTPWVDLGGTDTSLDTAQTLRTAKRRVEQALTSGGE